VPIVEELFWRGWLPRWIDNAEDFRKVPLGSFSRLAFWLTAILFASEHGAMWDVGLAAGVVYNWWMQKTRSPGGSHPGARGDQRVSVCLRDYRGEVAILVSVLAS
jgi:CAAX prenyl protease-like protein